MKIGFVGFGVMGCAMAGHLQLAGHQVRVGNRSPEKARQSGSTRHSIDSQI